MTDARPMIAVIIAFEKCNKKPLDFQIGGYWPSRIKRPIYCH